MKHPVKYNNLAFRIVGSLTAAQFIVMYGEKRTFFELLHNRMYYLALAVSFVIAFSVTCLVHVASKRLDRKYSWSDNPTERSVFQFVYGFLPSALAAAALAWVYFTVMGVDIVKVGYFRLDYPAVILLLLLLNMYYPLHYLIVTGRKQSQAIGLTAAKSGRRSAIPVVDMQPEGSSSGEADEQSSAQMPERLLTVQSGLQTISIDVNREVCFVYRSSRKNWLVTFSGETYLVGQSLTEFEQTYTDQLFRINRQVLVNFDAIAGYAEGSSRTLTLSLFPEYAHLPKEDYFVSVSQNKVAGFRVWFD